MRKRPSGLLLIYILINSTPGFAQTNTPQPPDLSAVSPIPLAAQLAYTTAIALIAVAILGILSTTILFTLRRLRWISPDQEIRLARISRVLFGGGVLFATTIPFLTLNFPPTISAPIILAACIALPTIFWLQNQRPNNHEALLD